MLYFTNELNSEFRNPCCWQLLEAAPEAAPVAAPAIIGCCNG